jgi:hypothetical protein
MQFARHALGETTQRKFSHRERRRLRVALHARRGTGEQDGAVAARQHAARRRLPDQKGAIGGDLERLGDFDRIELGERSARAVAGVVDDDVRRELGRVKIGEQLLDLVALGGIAVERLGASRLDELIELGRRARGQRDALANARASEAERPEPAPTMRTEEYVVIRCRSDRARRGMLR